MGEEKIEILKELGDNYILKNNYYNLLYNYINSKVNLKNYDDSLLNSNLNYIKLEKDQMDIYQYVFSDKLNYFYIRNDLYIGNLTEEERNFLNEKRDDLSNEEVSQFIEKTLNRILTLNKKTNHIVLGPISNQYMVESGTLVIGVRYDEFNLGGMTDEEWNRNHELQESDIYCIMLSLEQELRKKIEFPCQVIQYNDFNTDIISINSAKKQ